jgi:uncharacterized protein
MDRRTVLIVAIAGRALAVSARRAGYLPLVADCFGDEDTRAAAHAHVRLEAGVGVGLDEPEVLAALDALAAGAQPEGVVCGTGFEDRPQLLAAIARRWKLFGNGARTVSRLKDPAAFAKLCADYGIPHPEISLERPTMQGEWLEHFPNSRHGRPCPGHDGAVFGSTIPATQWLATQWLATEWLAKRKGGAGGLHVRPVLADEPYRSDRYFQRRVGGVPVSVLVLAAPGHFRPGGGRATIIGLSSQWSSPTPRHPFRYGGAVRPAVLGGEIETALARAAARIAVAAGLVGLNSVDFLVDDDKFWLLEVNPRPGATMDIFEPATGSLFALHVAACNGELPVACDVDGAAAAAIVYAGHDIAAVPAFAWPDWTADRQSAGTPVKADHPVCTVLASAATAADARTLLEQRAAMLVAGTHAWVS